MVFHGVGPFPGARSEDKEEPQAQVAGSEDKEKPQTPGAGHGQVVIHDVGSQLEADSFGSIGGTVQQLVQEGLWPQSSPKAKDGAGQKLTS